MKALFFQTPAEDAMLLSRIYVCLKRTRLSRRRMISLFLILSACVWPIEVTDGRGGMEPNHTTARNLVLYSINHSALSKFLG